MGKKKQSNSLGRSIIRDRFGSKGRRHADSHLHTSEIDDGYDWNKLNLRSVTEESSLDDFLATAQMAGTEFTAEKLNIKFVSQEARVGMLSADEMKKIRQAQDEHRELLNIPRRPSWDETTTATELDEKEREHFLEWRRKLAELQEVERLVLTPFEKNLQFWRQLWRVIERSDIIVQIVDGRNPLLFRSEDLEKYVTEVDSKKLNMVLVNKADYLTDTQRKMWAAYFDAAGVRVAFWSAVIEMEKHKEEANAADQLTLGGEETGNTLSNNSNSEDVSGSEEEVDDKNLSVGDEDGLNDAEDNRLGAEWCNNNVAEHHPTCKHNSNEYIRNHPQMNDELADSATKLNILNGSPSDVKCPRVDATGEGSSSTKIDDTCIRNNSDVLTGSELIDLFKCLHKDKKYTDGITTIGMVGYPNVGKSSTINALLQTKKVPVSATPGRTKHFQTLYLDKTLMLCDCPGLVMPTFVNTKADMVIAGILPIDQMRDYSAPVAAVCRLIPRHMLVNIYGVMIPKPHEGEDENRPPTPHELLGAYACMRGFMTHKGIPDYQRAARHILKDFVKGKLLYCTPPPDCDVEEFCPTPTTCIPTRERAHPQPQPIGSKSKQLKKINSTMYTSEMDKKLFEKNEPRIGTMGVRGGVLGYSSSDQSQRDLLASSGKPWKKHHNSGRKEKLRRITSHLDA